MSAELQKTLASVLEIKESKTEEAVVALQKLVLGNDANDAEVLKVKESAITELCALHVKRGDAKALAKLLVDLRPLFAVMPKVRLYLHGSYSTLVFLAAALHS